MFKRPTAKPVKKDTSVAMNDFQKATSENKFIRVMLIISVIIGALNYDKTDKLEKRQTVVIVPFGAKSSEMLITGESASTGYMRQIARLIVNNYGSVSKASVEQKYADLLGMVYEDRVEEFRKNLNERAKYFKQFNSVSQSMELSTDQPMVIISNPSDIKYETGAKNKYRYTFTAEQRKIIGDTAKPPEPIKMHIDYTIVNGQIWLLDIQ
ncbi:TPA: hypothetical protein MYP99_004618 [Citrobacter freundii]|nr:hypothetical protein [Citrobacter freundii]